MFYRPSRGAGNRARSLSIPCFAPRHAALRLALAGILGTAIGAATLLPAVAFAQEQQPFDIAAGPLGEALSRFAAQAGVSLSTDAGMTRGMQSPGLKGSYSVDTGFAQLLRGSGLEAVRQANGTFTLRKVPEDAVTLAPVKVVDSAVSAGALPDPYAGGQVARGGKLGVLGARDMMETPFNQTSYTSKLIEDQQARTGNDVLANDPSVNFQGMRHGGFEQYSIRGFGGLGQDRASVNGIYGAPAVVPMEMIERVEVLKGSNALLNGMPPSSNTVGGSVNFVTKRAGDDPLTRLTANYLSQSNLGAHLDVGRRFGDNKEFGARLNASARDGETSIDSNDEAFRMVSLGMDYRGERARLSTDLTYTKNDVDGVTGFTSLASGVPVVKAPDMSQGYLPEWTNRYYDEYSATFQGEWDITDRLTAYGAYSARNWGVGGFHVGPTITNVEGDYTGASSTWAELYQNRTVQAGLRASVETGPVHHELVLDTSRAWRDRRYSTLSGPTFTSNIYNPVDVPDPGFHRIDSPDKAGDTQFSSTAIVDTLSFLDRRAQLIVGARYQYVDNKSYNPDGSVRAGSTYDESVWTPMVGGVFKANTTVSIYLNYIEGLEPATVVGANYLNSGEAFPPYKTDQYEVGVKADWGTFVTTVSAFEITRPSYIDVATQPLPTRELGGEQLNRGLEFNVAGEPVTGVRVLGGFMLLDTELTKTQNGTNDGNKAPGVPELTAVLGGELDVPALSGFTLTGRVNYMDSVYYEAANQRSVPSWTTLDLGARYRLAADTPVTLRFDVRNALDRDYWTASSGTLWASMPRTFQLSATVDF